ncbi:MAG TPA: DUF1573 domain-containing protein [Ferruginibacter sp.]|jgi:hypothetical protein|nr:DUF1573 domain-containing protein [Ferruginibacter sp.]
MKKLLFSAAILAFASTVFAQTTTTTSTTTTPAPAAAPAAPATPKLVMADVAKFNTEIIDFGKIKQSVPAKGTFIVTNVGKTPLIIEQANPTCGCTISDYTKTPIAIGQTGVINATYNAANLGHFEKHLTVKMAGVDEIKSIVLTGEVLAAADFDAYTARQKAVADSIAALKPVKKGKKKAATN